MNSNQVERNPVVVVHGGAGRVPEGSLSARLAGCRRAAEIASTRLRAGGAALDAVQDAVVTLEDNPLFNAGVGAALNRDGEVELDASIMDGARLAAGAVGAVRNIRNPIILARRVLDDGRHILLAGPDATSFAGAAGIAECTAEELITDQQQERWRAHHGTVGCVVMDARGDLAAATSTGGITGKLPGRVGDSALIGCGTYADEVAAVSCTGLGEAIIRVVLGKSVADLVRAGTPPQQAAEHGVALLAARTNGECGVIVVDRQGRIGYAHNAACMPVCFVDQQGSPVAVS